jgi:DNA repair exonuclease SbcCD nuclease subunit
MKYAVVADVHLSKYAQDTIVESSGLPDTLHQLKTVLCDIADYCVENGIPNIIIAGDILHGKSIIYAIAQKVMLDYFRRYNEQIQFIVIDGNHDLSGKGEDVVSALEGLEGEDNVLWFRYDKPLRIRNIMYVPYSYNMEKTIRDNEADILISHFGLNEATLSSGISIKTKIGMRDLVGRYKLVILGHYHKPQEIITDDISVYYTGSPIQLDWGEKGEEKRFLVFDDTTLEVESIPTKNYRKHIELEITNENKHIILETAKDLEKYGDHVKIIKRENIDLGDAEKDFVVIDKSEQDITNRGISTDMSEEDRMRRFLQIKEIPENEHDEYLKIGLRLLEGE